MSSLLERNLEGSAATRTLLSDGSGVHLTATQIKAGVLEVASELEDRGARRVAFLADNSPKWAVLSLGTLESRACLVPIPTFFSDRQLLGVLATIGCDHLITDDPNRIDQALPHAEATDPLHGYCCFSLPASSPPAALPDEADLVTFTSGTSGQPKGVCLRADSLWDVAQALSTAVTADSEDVHLALLPLPILLSSIVAIHANLVAGARTILAPLASVGLRNGLDIDPEVFLRSLAEHRPSLLLLVPEILNRMVPVLEREPRDLGYLRNVAVGGAPLSSSLLERARAAGLPVFEGYGLSEAASVVTLNTARNDRTGTVGRSLPHRQVRIASDGEIIVAGSPFLGYLTPRGFQPAEPDLFTGDLGSIDADGFLTIRGRKSNVLVTSNGRNVSPEWVEKVLEGEESIEQAFVFGHGQSHLSAVLRVAEGSAASVPEALQRTNRELPAYARIKSWASCGSESEKTGAGNAAQRQALFARHASELYPNSN